MTAKSRTTFKSDQAVAFADNTTGNISALDLRTQVDDLADSASFPEDFGSGDNLLMTAAERAKLAFLTATQGVDLDAVEARVTALDQAFVDKGTWDASAGTFPGAGAALAGESWRVSVGGTVDSVVFVAGDEVRAIVDNASTTVFAANWFKTDNTDAVASVAGLTGTITGAGLKAALGAWVTADYADASVTLAKMANLAGFSIPARAATGSGVMAELTAGVDGVLRRSGSGDLAFGTLVTNNLSNNAVTNAKAAQMAQSTIKGRSTAGTGNPEDLTGTQATALLDVFTSAAKGLTPASGGGSTNFLRADGTWAAPAGGGGGVSATSYYNGTGSTLTKGTPVCLAAYNVATTTPGMAAADADASGFMPVIGVLGADCLNGASAAPIISGGEIIGIDTSAYTLNQVLYISNTAGTMTGTRPTTGAIQPVAIVSRVDATLGEIIVQLWEPGNILIEDFTVAVSDETTDLTAGTAKLTFRMPKALTLTAVRASVNTAPTGSTIIVDINETGTTILSTKLSIDASEKTSTTAATAAVISDASLADDAEITIDIDQVGSTIAGKGLKVTFYGYRP